MTATGPYWDVASYLPGRLRVRSEELLDSALLKRHCRLILTSCHWILGFRINGIAGSVCIDYPVHRRRDLEHLLEQALSTNLVREGFGIAETRPLAGARLRRTLAHGLGCAALLGLQGIGAIPISAMTLITAGMLWPLTRSVLRGLQRRQITVESLELSFSALLVGQGLAGEALVDLALNDAAEVAQSAVEQQDLDLDSEQLLIRLGDAVLLTAAEAPPLHGSTPTIQLKDVKPGERIVLQQGQHCFLTAHVIEGDLIVVNRLVDGSWAPQRIKQEGLIQAGALVIAGQAVVAVDHCLSSDPAYTLLHEHTKRMELDASEVDHWLKGYKQVMPPVLLAAGGAFLAAGSVERALAAFQFNPISDWETSTLATRLTAIADLNLQNLRIRHPDALSSIGKIKHLVISRSCLDCIGGIRSREAIAAGVSRQHGSLIQLLAGIQNWICGIDGTPIWSDQLQKVDNPITIEHVEIGDLRAGWSVVTTTGRHLQVVQRPQSPGQVRQHHLDPIDIVEAGKLLGTVTLLTQPDEHWIEACHNLKSMGITLHLVASEANERLQEIADPLGIESKLSHGTASASDRLDLVRQLQSRGEGVGFVGYVLHDLPALSQADVSIGLDVDDESRYLSRICDLSLGSDAGWIPRMIKISQNLQQARNQNFSLIGGTHLIASLATAAGWIAPIETVLLADIPLLLAELNNLWVLQKPRPLQPVTQAKSWIQSNSDAAAAATSS